MDKLSQPLIFPTNLKWLEELLKTDTKDIQERWTKLISLIDKTILEVQKTDKFCPLDTYPNLMTIHSDGQIGNSKIIDGILTAEPDYLTYIKSLEDEGEKKLAELLSLIIQSVCYRPMMIGNYILFLVYSSPSMKYDENNNAVWAKKKGLLSVFIKIMTPDEAELWK